MHAQIVVVNDCSKGHALECLKEELIYLLFFVFLENFLSESEVLRHWTALVVAPQEYNIFGII